MRITALIVLCLLMTPLLAGGAALADERDEAGPYNGYQDDWRPQTRRSKARQPETRRPRMRSGFGGERRKTVPAPRLRQRPRSRDRAQPAGQPARKQRKRPAATVRPSTIRPAVQSPHQRQRAGRKKHTPPRRYTRSIRKLIHYYNKYGQRYGNIKLFAKEGYWGPAVKVQKCHGDNVYSRFRLVGKGEAGRVWFQYQDTTFRNRRRHHWVMVDPGMIMRGQHVFLRAQSSKGSDIVSIKVSGTCIETPPTK